MNNKQVLELLVERINEITKSPKDSWTNGKANVGNFHLSWAYGGVSLHRMMNDGGGVDTPLGMGYVPKKDMEEKLRAFISGLTFKS